MPTTGNVGIGTLTPSAALDVNGNMIVDSSLTVKDSLRVQKRLIVDQDVNIKGKTVLVGDVKAKANFKVLGDTKLKGKAVIDGLTKMNGDAKVFGNLKLPNLTTAINPPLFLTANANGKVNSLNKNGLLKSIYTPGTTCLSTGVNVGIPIWNATSTPTYGILFTGIDCPARVGIGIENPRTTLDVVGDFLSKSAGIGNVLPTEFGGALPSFYVKRGGLPNAITAKFEASDATSNRSIFFTNTLTNGGHNPLSTAIDVGLFWTNNFNGTNGAGFVLAPKSNTAFGMRIDDNGRFGFNTAVIPQVQYTMKSNSQTTLLFNLSNTPGTNYGIRAIVTNPTDAVFTVSSDPNLASNSEVFIINGDGSVGIGTTKTSGYMLTVEGNMRSRSVQVDATNIVWFDHVFNKDYQLTSLTEVENYINKYNHLPDVPSEKEVKQNGIDLGKMDAILLRKIEELTLYMIALQKDNKALQLKVKQLEAVK
ncbi:MAG: hypothetical protein COA97_10125 [Flavobacteriales bacterium]|nr:MAG: hypothetical protein COA97_10125 [Flavobacteriales bacterium]